MLLSYLQESLAPKIKDLDVCKDWVSARCYTVALRGKKELLTHSCTERGGSSSWDVCSYVGEAGEAGEAAM